MAIYARQRFTGNKIDFIVLYERTRINEFKVMHVVDMLPKWFCESNYLEFPTVFGATKKTLKDMESKARAF